MSTLRQHQQHFLPSDRQVTTEDDVDVLSRLLTLLQLKTYLGSTDVHINALDVKRHTVKGGGAR